MKKKPEAFLLGNDFTIFSSILNSGSLKILPAPDKPEGIVEFFLPDISDSGGDVGYELQVLDNYNNTTYVNGQVGSMYKQSIPLANPCRKPGEWQNYEVVWTAPRFKEDGTLIQLHA